LPGYAERIAKYSDSGYMRQIMRRPVTMEGGSLGAPRQRVDGDREMVSA
jgi:hypothetical protein